jgi:hypothetical protein
MQCSCCRSESENLREYSLSATDEKNRKTIQTFHLCAICRIVYLIKPLHISARARQAVPAAVAHRVA